ncbi:aldose epimerase family protein [Lactococcus formosensis]|uniref:aldose epimerase family protein n=1 Tax=Lactococcus formosensis TaxID=1281486 RepID=UPI002890F9AE|nr:aldose epimerase family protein [Lactococcus formosensis]MDT2727471.1 galactose mutarotase [Lactococcus formosensis]
MSVRVEKVSMGEGKTTQLVRLENASLTVELVAYGAHLYRVLAKDRQGIAENVVLNVTPISALATDLQYFGATVGPVAGRIKQAQIGDLSLEVNDNTNSLHSGSQGWSFQEWDLNWQESDDEITVTFSYIDHKSGFPGPIAAQVIYHLIDNQLSITFTGESPVATFFNPTNHGYFNLSGELKTDIRQQILEISADHILDTDAELIPTGLFLPVAETPYDFTTAKPVENALNALPSGLDTAFVFDDHVGDHHVTLYDKASGRRLDVTSEARSVIIYSVSAWDRDTQVNDHPMAKELGLAIEFQELPDLPHHPEWGSIALLPDEKVSKTIHYRFGVS